MDDGRSLLAERRITSEGQNWAERQLTVVMYGADGAIADTVGTYADGRWGMLPDHPRLGLYPLFESFFRIDAAGKTVVIAHGSKPQFALHTVDSGVTLTRIVRWNTGARSITPVDIDAERRRLAEPYEDMDPAMRQRLLAPLISEDRPIADQFPAFISLRLGKDGRVWVRDFVKPTEPPEQRWLVFDSDGRFACRAKLPDVSETLEFGSDYLLALDRDDIGIERVLKYSLTPPARSDAVPER
jgi:hypothetical protein